MKRVHRGSAKPRRTSSARPGPRKLVRAVPPPAETVELGISGIIETRPSPLDTDEVEMPEVFEFAQALDRYKREHGRPFPTCGEILHVLRKLGWEKRPHGRGEGRR